MTREPPPSIRSLQARVRNLARERRVPEKRIQRVVANVVIGQMMPPGLVKGGSSIKVRLGDDRS